MSGQKYHGRFMLPNMTVPEADISQAGIMSGTGLANLTSQWSQSMSLITASDHNLYLGHSSSEVAPTQFSSVSVAPKVGSMPHRIR